MNELNELRRQYRNNKYKVFYFSKGLNNIQLFVEFLFEILHEKDEPLMACIEVVKAGLKLRELWQLVSKEKVNSYIELESYRELTIMKDIYQTQIKLMRTKRRVKKLELFHANRDYKQLKNNTSEFHEIEAQYDLQYQRVVLEGLGISPENQAVAEAPTQQEHNNL